MLKIDTRVAMCLLQQVPTEFSVFRILINCMKKRKPSQPYQNSLVFICIHSKMMPSVLKAGGEIWMYA